MNLFKIKNTRIIREAIADAFPSRYNRWSWRDLIADYVDIQLQVLTIRRRRYNQEHTAGIDQLPPSPPAALQTGIVMLAKQQGLTHAFLTLSHYTLTHQVRALTAENHRLQHELSELVSQYANYIPAYDTLLRTIYLKLPHLGTEQADVETLLQTFIDHKLTQLEKAIHDWYEALEDGALDEAKPQPSPDLLQAADTLAYRNSGTFAVVSFELQQARHERKTLNGVMEMVEEIARTHKSHYDQLLPGAQKLGEEVEFYRRTTAYGKWLS